MVITPCSFTRKGLITLSIVRSSQALNGISNVPISSALLNIYLPMILNVQAYLLYSPYIDFPRKTTSIFASSTFKPLYPWLRLRES